MAKPLSETMLHALELMERAYGSKIVNFRSGEALRKRGLANRRSERLTACFYVTRDAEVDQGFCSTRKPVWNHEWYITEAGHAALQEAGR